MTALLDLLQPSLAESLRRLPAAGEVPPYLVDIAVFLVAGAAIAYLCTRFGLVPIVGFLLAGAVIGPNALGLVHDPEMVDALAEIGVILLLFTIGIEFSLEKLARITGLIFGGGGLQVALTSLAVMGGLMAFGVDWRTGLFSGFLMALSSTAIVLKLLADQGQTGTEQGQVSLGLLIFQDLAIIVMVLMVPILGGVGGSPGDISWALTKAALLIGAVLLLARRAMPPLLEMVARTCSDEVFLLTVAAICMGTAYLTSLAGVSVSLGAFLAGLVVSESRFSHRAMSEILPLQVLFSAVFFISIGMLLDPGFLIENWLFVLAGVAAVLVIKIVTTGVSVLALGRPFPVACASALLLAQVGEFSFVLERAGREVGLFPAGSSETGSQAFISSTVLLMVMTPLLARLSQGLSRRLERRGRDRKLAAAAEAAPSEEFEDMQNHVIVAGYGPAACSLVRVLHGSRIPYVITTLSPGNARNAEEEGFPVLRGDASRLHILKLAGIEAAKAIVIADDDPSKAHRVAGVARNANPTLDIVVRTSSIDEIAELEHLGVNRVIAQEMESIVQLFAVVLRDYQVPPEDIDTYVESMRRGGYQALTQVTENGKPAVVCNLGPECFDNRSVLLQPGSDIVGKTLSELDLLERHGLELLDLRRQGRRLDFRSQDVRLRAGDTVLLAGQVDAFVKAAPLFRARPLERSEEVELTEWQRRRTQHIDLNQEISLQSDSQEQCPHMQEVGAVKPGSKGCGECLAHGGRWVHLRLCMNCGFVGCCESSPGSHARKHFEETGHRVIRSLEEGEDWAWCFEDETMAR